MCSSNVGLPHSPAEWSISIVDDDLRVRKSLVNLLNAVGYTTASFASGDAFIQSLAANAPDCVLIDSRMDGMQGIDVQRHLQSTPAGPAIVCMSAFWNDAATAEAYECGAHACLSKPFSEELLLSTLKEAISARQGDVALPRS